VYAVRVGVESTSLICAGHSKNDTGTSALLVTLLTIKVISRFGLGWNNHLYCKLGLDFLIKSNQKTMKLVFTAFLLDVQH